MSTENQICKRLRDQSCDHGINPALQECSLCTIENKIFAQNTRIALLESTIDSNQNKIVKTLVEDLQTELVYLRNRIEKIEPYNWDNECHKSAHVDMLSRLNKLERESIEQIPSHWAERIESLERAFLKEINFTSKQNAQLVDLIKVIQSDLGDLKDKVEGFDIDLKGSEKEFKEVRPAKDIDMNFGEAIDAMRKGYKIGRWHRDDIYVWLRDSDKDCQACLMVRTVNDELYPWTPNQQEILATNWRIVE